MQRGFRWMWIVGVLALAAGGGAACNKTPTSPSNSATFAIADVLAGTGAQAATGDVLNVTYTGWLYDVSKTDDKGPVFDTNVGGTPLTFTLGAGTVIQGWEQGLAGMRVGGIRRLTVPSSLAYGGNRFGIIPPYATLLFDVQLLSIGD